MSAYNVHPTHIDYLICSECGTEAFAWMAEIFACPACGQEEYVRPPYDDESTATDESRPGGSNTTMSGGTRRAVMTKESRKRKRRVSDE